MLIQTVWLLLAGKIPEVESTLLLPVTTPWPWLVVLAVVMLGFGAAWAAAEAAFTRLTLATAHDLVEDDRHNARIVRYLVKQRHEVLLAAAGGKTLAVTLEVLAVVMALLNTHWPWWAVLGLAFVICVGANGLIVSLVSPHLGRRQPASVAIALARMILLGTRVLVLFRPVQWLYQRIIPPSGMTHAEARQEMAEDLRELVDQMGQDENLDIEEDDREMLRSVFELGTTIVRELMVPRTDMIAIHCDKNLDKAVRLFVLSGYSRIPVYGDDTDDILGIIYLKDVVRELHHHKNHHTHSVKTLMRPPYFVPEVMLADDLLRLMREEMPHMTMCVDEWGGISGLVTIEDLVEEVIGDVVDEHDHAQPEPIDLGEGYWQIPAKLPVDELGDLFDLEIDDEDVDTAGGLLAKALGKVPLPGQKARVQGVELKAESVEGRRRQIATIIAHRIAKIDDEYLDIDYS
ncbi:MAG: hemolysin family protein [Actinomycetaceae bacterium]|nr:hemolysin family protein [Actinomycetaceae bacterium]